MRAAPRIYASFCAASIVAFAVLPAGGARAALLGAVGLASAVAVLSALRAPGPAGRGPWVFLIVSLASFVAVRAVDRALGDPNGPAGGLPVGVIQAAYAFAFVTGVVMANARRRERERGVTLDGAIAGVAAGVLLWALVVLPLVRSGDASLREAIALDALPLFDLMAMLATALLALRDRGRDPGLVVVASAWSLFLVADIGYAVTADQPAGVVATVLATFAMSGCAALGLGFLVTAPAPPPERGTSATHRRLTGRSTLVLGLALVVAPIVQAVTEIVEGNWDQVVLTAGAVAIAILVVLRLHLDHARVRLAEEEAHEAGERLQALVRNSSDLIAVLDGRCILSYVAPSSERLFGVAPDRITGRSVLDLLHPDDVPIVRSTIAHVLGSPDVTGGLEVRIRDRNGWRWVEVRYGNLLDDPGIRGIVLNVRDLTDRHAAQTALLEREAQYRSFFEKNQAVMLLVDPVTDDIADANPAAAEFYGYPLERLRGMSIAGLRADPGDAILEEMRRAQEERRPFWLLRHRVANGLVRPVEVYSGSIAIGGESLVYEIVHDITERRLAEDALRETEERYRTLVEQLPVVTYMYGFYRTDPSKTLPGYVGPQISTMLGVSPQEWLAGDGLWASMVHPDDLERVDRDGTAARAAGAPIDAEYRMVRRDGEVIWVRDSSVPIRNATGDVVAWQGIYEDITEQRAAEEAVRASERRFRAVFDGAAVGIARMRLDGSFLEANDALAELFGCARGDLAGRFVRSFLAEAPADGPSEEFRQLALGRIERFEADRHYRRTDGRLIWCHVTASLVRDGRGAPDLAILMVEDISARKAAEDELAIRALHDALTGLPNRDLLLDRLDVALSRLDRDAGAVAVLFLDLDGFKRVNDEIGHQAGDVVLVEVARRLRASLRPADTLARFGGDEFVAVAADIDDPAVAGALVERLTRCLDEPIELPGGATASLGVSVGMTLATDRSRTGDRLIRDADTAMYLVKRDRRSEVASAPAIAT